MASSEEEFQKQLLQTFKEEAQEHIDVLTEGLLKIEKDFASAATPDHLQTIYREAHSLKGAARVVDLELIQNICQAFENLLAALRDGKLAPSAEFFQASFEVLDYIKKLAENPEAELESPADYNAFINRLKGLLEQPKEAQEKSEEAPQQPEKAPEKPQETLQTPEEAPQQLEETEEEPAIAPQALRHDVSPEPLERLLRISSRKLDKLIMQIEELLLVKIVHRELRAGIEKVALFALERTKLEKQLSILHHFLHHRIPKESSFYEPLLTLFQEIRSTVEKSYTEIAEQIGHLQKEANQSRHFVDTTISALLDDTKKLLMQPFSTLLTPFPRMVRDIAKELGKEINFEIEGGDVEIDRRILEELKDPLVHMVRNSIDHGIESQEERKKAGKPPAGSIKILISQVGSNHVDLIFMDDGRGFQLEKIKEKAIKSQMATEKSVATMKPQELLQLAFLGGVSTAEIITSLSGRGLGLNIVAEKVERLGGSYTVDTKQGEGVVFQLSLPLTVATYRGLQVVVGEEEFIIPTQNVTRIVRRDLYELGTVENQQVLFLEQKNYPFRFLSDLLKVPSHKQTAHLALLLRSGNDELAVGVEKILSEQEVFVKGLGKQLQHVPNIAAGTILEGGRVVPILDVTDLMKSALVSTQQSPLAEEAVEERAKRTVLVVEDVLTSRMLFKNILQSAGYLVLTAADGVEALDILLREKVDVLVTDIEMPRMRGFELIEKMKGEEKLKSIPVVIITACETEEDKRKGVQLGVDAYIEKSSFVQNELLSILEKVL